MANDYATIEECKAEAEISDAAHDLTLTRLLDAAAKTVDRFCRRPEGFFADATASARYYPGSGMGVQWIDECILVSAVAVKDSPSDDENAYVSWVVGIVGTTIGADIFPASGDPRNPDYNRTPYTFLIVGPNGDYNSFPKGSLPNVKVTSKWGFAATVPADIKTATIMQAVRWFKRLQGGMGDAAGSAELGQIMYTQRLDPDVALILQLGGYRRMAVG